MTNHSMDTQTLRQTLQDAPPPPDLWPEIEGRMRRRSRWRIAAAAAGVAAVGVGIGIPLALRGGPDHGPAGGGGCAITVTQAPVPSGSATEPAYVRDPEAVAVAGRQLAAYLHSWCAEGATAAYAYLDPRWRGDPPGENAPSLAGGAVEIFSMTPTADGYTGYVNLTLHLDGDPMAWNDGVNSRFVTLTRSADAPGGFALTLATGP
jgi:hypothetical protein